MKKISKLLILVAVFSLSALTKVKAQEIGVSVQLNRPHEYEENERNHPRRPSARHVWIAEEWVAQGGRYVYRPGYWSLPPRDRAVWVKGYWTKHPYRPGYKWHPGHWRD